MAQEQFHPGERMRRAFASYMLFRHRPMMAEEIEETLEQIVGNQSFPSGEERKD